VSPDWGSGRVDGLSAAEQGGEDLDQHLPLEERQRLRALAPGDDAREDILLSELLEPPAPRKLARAAQELGDRRCGDPFVVRNGRDERQRRIQGEGVEDRAHGLVFVLDTARHEERHRASDRVRCRLVAPRPHRHLARATRQDDHRPVVCVEVLVEADAPLVSDPHRSREIDDLVQEVPLGGPLEALPLRVGVGHATILTK
jgi:hypothetical protein